MAKNIIGFVLLLVFINSAGFTQSYNTDPAFSPQNYKHPNKAKIEAEKKQSPTIVKEEYVRIIDNYKTSNRVSKKIPITVAANFSRQKEEIQRSYKQNFNPRPRLDRDEQIRKFLEEMSAKNKEENSNVESD
ncbi:MAG TPA: hypothetical protein VD908_18035 [Cytophagales bacterium]|nr:hypothetical protein [Cytophagales bacterium]